MSDNPYQHIGYEVEDRIATITLNRPDKLNAFTNRMVHEFLAVLDEIDGDDNVRAVIVTGAGRAFCAGADMSEGGASTFEKTSSNETGAADPESLRGRDGGGIVTLRLYRCLKPLIAAINGPAVGVGVTMTLPMDIRLASTTARLGFVFPQRGIVPEAASSWFLPKVVGLSQALEWTMTGRVFDADEALAGGLVRSLHEPDDLVPAARALATEIASSTSAISVAMARQMLWRIPSQPHPMAAHRVDSAAVPQMGSAADAAEGITAFFEKRPAEFTQGPSTDMPEVYPWWDEPPFRA
jgi:enoyl-CoA hydratase/carnithine racemase